MKGQTFGPYSPLVKVDNLYFLSGQVGVDPHTKESGKDIKTQTSQALVNIQTLLETHGLEMKHVVKTTVYLTSMDYFAEMNEIYEGFFSAPRPARSTVAVKELPRVGTNKLMVEIEAIAFKKV